jgi:hypothetical protein
MRNLKVKILTCGAGNIKLLNATLLQEMENPKYSPVE